MNLPFDIRILPYERLPVQYETYDPGVIDVAREIENAVQWLEPQLEVMHIGSTSVPGCRGRGVVDLAVLYPEGLLARAREVLDSLGFQRQQGDDPFPESRPMRVGAMDCGGRRFQMHAHVIAAGSTEHQELAWFRNTLCANPDLRRRFEICKRDLAAQDDITPAEYAAAKGDFIASVLEYRELM